MAKRYCWAGTASIMISCAVVMLRLSMKDATAFSWNNANRVLQTPVSAMQTAQHHSLPSQPPTINFRTHPNYLQTAKPLGRMAPAPAAPAAPIPIRTEWIDAPRTSSADIRPYPTTAVLAVVLAPLSLLVAALGWTWRRHGTRAPTYPWLMATAVAEQTPGPAGPTGSPTEMDVDVYIEHTDAYGVVYYAEYASLFFDAAIEDHWRRSNPDVPPHAIVAINEHKFMRPAVLGDACRVVTEVVEEAPDGSGVYRQVLQRRSNDEELVSATVRIAPVSAPVPTWPLAEGADAAGVSHTLAFKVYSTDVDARTGGVSLRAVLRAFERVRTEALGGPAMLQQLLSEGRSVVIGKMDKIRLAPGQGQAGATLEVRCRTVLRRKRIFVFYESLVDAEGQVLAEAEITGVCIDSESLRPSEAPDWIVERFTA